MIKKKQTLTAVHTTPEENKSATTRIQSSRKDDGGGGVDKYGAADRLHLVALFNHH